MDKKPTCPYCGTEMMSAGAYAWYWFSCPKCRAESPRAGTMSIALAMACCGASVWHSVKDRLPRNDHDVLVACRSKNGVYNIDKGYYNGERMVHRGHAEVTHWMPLPEAPKEGD